MKMQLGKSSAFGLAALVAATLTPVGTHVTTAESARPTSWQAEIPRSDWNLGWNLAGFSEQYNGQYAVFEDQGPRGEVWVVGLGPGPTNEGTAYHFVLLVDPDTAGYGVDIADVVLDNLEVLREGEECGFPGPSSQCGSDCMTCFLNGRHPKPMYDFSLAVGTLENPEVYNVALGRLNLDMWDRSPDLHRLHCESEPRSVEIERTGQDEWTIRSVVGKKLFCNEYYVVALPRSGKKGGNPQDKTEDRVVMTAETSYATPFKFETIWTRKGGR